jgi:hypothetical protein
MDAKTLVNEAIEREYEYLKNHDVGTDEYNDSLKRLTGLEEKLADLEKNENEKKDQWIKNAVDVGKFVLGLAVSVGMSCVILKWEETGSITTALRPWITGTATKKMF